MRAGRLSLQNAQLEKGFVASGSCRSAAELSRNIQAVARQWKTAEPART